MTTREAAAAHAEKHVAENAHRGLAVFNPYDKPIDELPAIYGFNNGGHPGWIDAVALSDDGVCLGAHTCSADCYIPHDLGVLEGTRPDRHETYREHYPDGYRMEFVPADEIKTHDGLQGAIARAARSGGGE